MTKLELLREEMMKENIGLYLIPTSDPHQSEYISEHWKGREWLSGFTGSAGILVVTSSEAGLWTDGRYFIQAEQELKNIDITLFKMGEKNVITVKEYIKHNYENDKKIGVYGQLISISQYESIFGDIEGVEVEVELDLIDRIWTDRPDKAKSKLFIHDEKFSGEATKRKIRRLRERMKVESEDYRIISSLDEIAWLLNLRGNDIKNNPVFLSYVIVSDCDCKLFTDAIISDSIYHYALEQGFSIESIEEFEKSLEQIRFKTVGMDPNKTSIWTKTKLSGNKKKYSKEILTEFESIKNDIQIVNLKKTYRDDGIAMIKLLSWIERERVNDKITEIEIAKKAREYRESNKNFIEESFDTIAGYKEHGAMMHYCADESSNYNIEGEGLLLIDSGGQYLTGTTDITRTISIGNPTLKQKEHYTLVLKGMINLSRARFLEDTNGATLDILAREFLWREGIDYKSGTGHGIGYFLSVHLGENRISPKALKSKFKPGMIVTNEPGVYIEGEYGIRIENVLLVKEFIENESGKFLEFETLTLCPLDKKLIDIDLLTYDEKKWISDYHSRIREEIGEFLTEEELELIWYIEK